MADQKKRVLDRARRVANKTKLEAADGKALIRAVIGGFVPGTPIAERALEKALLRIAKPYIEEIAVLNERIEGLEEAERNRARSTVRLLDTLDLLEAQNEALRDALAKGSVHTQTDAEAGPDEKP